MKKFFKYLVFSILGLLGLIILGLLIYFSKNHNIYYVYKEEKNKINSLSKILKLNSPLNKIVNSYLEVDGLKERLSRTMANKIEKENIMKHIKPDVIDTISESCLKEF